MPTKIHLEMQVFPGREWKYVLRRWRWNFFRVIPNSSVSRSKEYLKKSLSSIWSQGVRLSIFADLATDCNCIDNLNLQLLCLVPCILFVLPELLREDSHWILMQDIFCPMSILCVCFSKLYLPLMIKIALTLEFRANNHHLWWSSCGSESCYAVCFIFTQSWCFMPGMHRMREQIEQPANVASDSCGTSLFRQNTIIYRNRNMNRGHEHLRRD